MRRSARLGLAVWAGGCLTPPELPPFEGVPLESRPFTPCASEDPSVRVGCVIDGDTVEIGTCGAGERLRLLGVDAPETDADECYAHQSAEFLADLVAGELVTVSYDRVCTGVFGRTLGYVWLRGDLLLDLDQSELEPFLWSWYLDPREPAILLNEALLGLGMVRDYPEEIAGTLAFQDRLDRARDSARSAGRGLWGACDRPEAR